VHSKTLTIRVETGLKLHSQFDKPFYAIMYVFICYAEVQITSDLQRASRYKMSKQRLQNDSHMIFSESVFVFEDTNHIKSCIVFDLEMVL